MRGSAKRQDQQHSTSKSSVKRRDELTVCEKKVVKKRQPSKKVDLFFLALLSFVFDRVTSELSISVL